MMTRAKHTLTVPLQAASVEEFDRLAEAAVAKYFTDQTGVTWEVDVHWDDMSGPPCLRGMVVATRSAAHGEVNRRVESSA